MKRGKATNADARAIVIAKYNRFAMQLFTPDEKEYPALRVAEMNGWIWFFKRDRAAVTAAGLKVIGDYQGAA